MIPPDLSNAFTTRHSYSQSAGKFFQFVFFFKGVLKDRTLWIETFHPGIAENNEQLVHVEGFVSIHFER